MEKIQQNIHVIVAPSAWQDDPLKYRRHRLAEFLHKQKNTKQVIWICPEATETVKSLVGKPSQEELSRDLLQIKVPDFKGLIKYFSFLQRSLIKLIQPTNDESCYYLWYTYPAYAGLVVMNIWKSVIYDCSDLWIEAEQASNVWLDKIKRNWINKTEMSIISSADQCFGSSTHLLEHVSQSNSNVKLIENGVDFEHFDLGNELEQSGVNFPVLGFIGGLKPWKIDFSLLLEVAKRKPEWNITLVGSIYGTMNHAYEQLEEQSNVKIFAAVPFSDVPKYVHQLHVGLLPYLDNEYNHGVFPLKFFEYLAAGLPIVGCGLPSTKHYVEQHVYEYTDNQVDNFIQACERAIEAYPYNKKRRYQLAKAANWDDKLVAMWSEVEITSNSRGMV